MALNNKVKELRLREGLPRVRLAQMANVSDKTLSVVEESIRKVAPTTMHKIVKGFNRIPHKQRDYKFADLFPNDPS